MCYDIYILKTNISYTNVSTHFTVHIKLEIRSTLRYYKTLQH